MRDFPVRGISPPRPARLRAFAEACVLVVHQEVRCDLWYFLKNVYSFLLGVLKHIGLPAPYSQFNSIYVLSFIMCVIVYSTSPVTIYCIISYVVIVQS